MEPISRDARTEDATDIAKLSYLAGQSHVERSIYDLLIAGPPGMTGERLESMRQIINTEKPSWMSYRFYHVIEVDGAVASGLASYTPEQDGDRQLGQAMMEAGWSVRNLLSMSHRMKFWSKTDPGREPGFLIIENVATYEPYRGRGFTSELLAVEIERAKSEGLAGLQLTVLLGNDPAIRVYEKAGFHMAKTKQNKKFEEMFGSAGAGQMLMRF